MTTTKSNNTEVTAKLKEARRARINARVEAYIKELEEASAKQEARRARISARVEAYIKELEAKRNS